MTGDRSAAPERRDWKRALFSSVFLLAGGAGIAVALHRGWDRSGGLWPGTGRSFTSVLLAGVGLAGFTMAWTEVAGARGHRLLLARSFLVSMLGRYVPGGVWQAAGQVVFSLGTGLSARVLWSRYVGFSILMACAALVVVGATAPWFEAGPARVRPLLALGLGGALLADGRVARLVDRTLHRLSRRLLTRDALWSPGSRQPAMAWAAGGFVAYGAGFAVVVTALDPSADAVTATAAFVAAWLVGYVAVPVPAGLGVREAVLVLLLAPVVPTATVLAASIVYRVAGMVAEAVLAAGASLAVRLQPSPTLPGDPGRAGRS